MSSINLIEASYTGPIPDRERAIVRLGSDRAVDTVRARAMVHHLSTISLKVLRAIGQNQSTGGITPGKQQGADSWYNLREDLRFYLRRRAEWKHHLRKLHSAGQILRCLCFA